MATELRKKLQVSRRYHVGDLNSLVRRLNFEPQQRSDDPCGGFASEQVDGSRLDREDLIPVDLKDVSVPLSLDERFEDLLVGNLLTPDRDVAASRLHGCHSGQPHLA